MSDSVIDGLRARYRASGEQKHAALAELLQAYRGGDVTQPSVQANLRESLHKLAGSSGMYGYQDLCTAARKALAYFELSGDEATRTFVQADAIAAIETVMQELNEL